MDPIDIFARLLGAFYAIGGALTLRAVATDAVLDKALAALSLTPPSREDIIMRRAMTVAAALTGLSGIALLMLSSWALLLFVSSLVLQGVWLIYKRARQDDEDPGEALGRRRRINAAVLWAAATGLVVWLYWSHRLTTLLEPWTPTLMGLALLGGFAWVRPHLTWNPASPPPPEPAWDGGPFIPPPERVRLAMRFGYLPLYDADTGFAVNGADYLPTDLFQRMCAWESVYCEAVDPEAWEDGPAFSVEQAIAHRDEGRAIAAALEEVFGQGNVEAPLYGEGARPRILPDEDAAPPGSSTIF